MKYLFVILVSSFLICNLSGQTNYYKVIDLETSATAYQILKKGTRFFISIGNICENDITYECSGLSEISESGVTLWIKQLSLLDIGSRSTFIDKDTIICIGNNDPWRDKFVINKINLNGDDLGTFYVNNGDSLLLRVYAISSLKYNNNYIISGQGILKDSQTSITFVSDVYGKLLNSFNNETLHGFSTVTDSYIDQDGYLNNFYKLEKGGFLSDYHKIIKFDNNFNQVWSYTSDTLRTNDSYPKGCELPDGRIAFVYGHKELERGINSVRCIKPDKTISWEFNWPNVNSWQRVIRRLIVTKNGDIIGCGEYTSLKNMPRINGSPFVFRLNNKGKMLWERAYVEVAADGKDKTGNLWDIIELDNGDLIAAGHVKNENWDILLIRIDSEGCIDQEETCQEINIIDITSGSEDVSEEKSDFSIYPNPASDHITIETSHPCKIEMYDITGHKVLTTSTSYENSTYVDIADLKNGLYFVKCTTSSGVVSTHKFVKQ
ncbi:MAG: T9SS type A sorting domain-containing protein [Saprospiraceae bacterium]